MRNMFFLLFISMSLLASNSTAQEAENCKDVKAASKGPFIYSKVEELEGKPKPFDGTCANLVNWYTKAGRVKTWREGEMVKGNKNIKKGTAIATMVNGLYPNKKKGNHAALYISQSASGIKIMDQWNDKDKIGSRTLPFLGKKADETYKDPSNNGDAFSIIMHE